MDINNVLAADLSQITTEVVLTRNDDGTPKAGFLVVGMDSPQAREEIEAQRTSAIERRKSRGGKKMDPNSPEGQALFNEIFQENQTNLAAACTVGWFGFTDNGQPAAFDREKVRGMYAKYTTWRDLAQNQISDGANFLPESALSAVSTSGKSRGSTQSKKAA